MTVSPSIPATVEIRRNRLLLLVAAVAIVAAAISWAATNAADSGSSSAQSNLVAQVEQYGRGLTNTGTFRTPVGNGGSYATRIARLSRVQQAAAFGGPGAMLSVLYGLTPKEAMYVRGITSMTPEQIAAAFGSR